MSGVVLLSGFEPFGGHAANPSEQVVRLLDGGSTEAGARLHGLVLPVDFNAAPRRLLAEVERLRPRLVLALGLAPGRSEFSVERVALNLADTDDPDNVGGRPRDVALLAGAPPALWATWPVRAVCEALQARGWPAGLSLSAGSFVCNAVFFRLLLATASAPIEAGFLHLPPAARLPLEQQVQAVQTAIEAALQSRST